MGTPEVMINYLLYISAGIFDALGNPPSLRKCVSVIRCLGGVKLLGSVIITLIFHVSWLFFSTGRGNIHAAAIKNGFIIVFLREGVFYVLTLTHVRYTISRIIFSLMIETSGE